MYSVLWCIVVLTTVAIPRDTVKIGLVKKKIL